MSEHTSFNGRKQTFPQLGVLLSLSVLASDVAVPPSFSPSVSNRPKPIVAQATGMNVMVTLLLFSFSIKSKLAQTQLFTVCLSGTPPVEPLSSFTHKTHHVSGLNYPLVSRFWDSYQTQAFPHNNAIPKRLGNTDVGLDV